MWNTQIESLSFAYNLWTQKIQNLNFAGKAGNREDPTFVPLMEALFDWLSSLVVPIQLGNSEQFKFPPVLSEILEDQSSQFTDIISISFKSIIKNG